MPYEATMTKLFDCQIINVEDFKNPNKECGAEHAHKNWKDILEKQYYEEFDLCFFFDGDSDRVICKIRGCSHPFDGNSFLAMYVKTLLKIQEKLKSLAEVEERFIIHAVGNIVTNEGVFNSMKKNKIASSRADVGIQNLYEKAMKK